MARRTLGLTLIAITIVTLIWLTITPERSSLQVQNIKDLANRYSPSKGDAASDPDPDLSKPLGSGSDHLHSDPSVSHESQSHESHESHEHHDGHENSVHDITKDPTEHKEPAHAVSHAEDHHPEAAQKSGTPGDLDADIVNGKPIMSKMTNQTARAQLGNAGWRLLHTILAQYPEKPSSDDKVTLETYLKLFSRVYPCRECAEHFQQLLNDYPPQLSSRKAAIMWGCEAHNKVNRRLDKPEFDCAYISDKYDCGCGDDEGEEKTEKAEKSGSDESKPAQKKKHKGAKKTAKLENEAPMQKGG